MSGSARSALAGGLAVAAGAVVAELVAEVVGRPQAGTLIAVGGVLVDAAPTPVKEFAVATLGTADKPVLLAGVAVVLAALAGLLGVLGYRDRRAGLAGAALLGLVGVAAALTRPAATVVDALPTLLGAVVIGGALLALLRPLGHADTGRRRGLRLPHRMRQEEPVPAAGSTGPAVLTIETSIPPDERRSARRAPTRTSETGVDGGPSSPGPHSLPPELRRPGRAALLGRADTTAQIRQAVRLPAPADPAPPLPAGLAPGFLTSNTDFYRVDTALTVPRVGSRRVDCCASPVRVDAPVELSFTELARETAHRARRHVELRLQRGRRPSTSEPRAGSVCHSRRCSVEAGVQGRCGPNRSHGRWTA